MNQQRFPCQAQPTDEHWRLTTKSWNRPMALLPPPTHASSTSGSPPNASWHCAFVSRPMIAWKSRTCSRSTALISHVNADAFLKQCTRWPAAPFTSTFRPLIACKSQSEYESECVAHVFSVASKTCRVCVFWCTNKSHAAQQHLRCTFGMHAEILKPLPPLSH